MAGTGVTGRVDRTITNAALWVLVALTILPLV